MSKVKYARMPVVPIATRQWPGATITRAPVWCAVDLRDGNQALPNPMTPPQKRRYFQELCAIGFKQIEIGFPSASADDFDFCRELIEQKLIPPDVTISVLTQAREHLVARTLEALAGVERAIVHFYIATSELHSRFVFGLTDDEVLEKAVAACRQIREGARTLPGATIGLEFSPEEFTDTTLAFAVAICDAVVAAWAPAPGEKVVLNLPQTVERRLPCQYADLIEEFRRRQQFRDQTLISVHVHNDMGMAVAATMQSLMAGADRVEGTLFGHGERTGNVDVMTVAMNLEYLGVDTGLDFSRLPEIAALVEEVTGIATHVRHPYAGELVFTAFSGSHQDAIHKGLSRRDELAAHFAGWKIPYLHVDPSTIGRRFERFIRINSQSGKGGIAHVLEHEYSVKMPRWVQMDLAARVKTLADGVAREVTSAEVWELFQKAYVAPAGPLALANYWPRPSKSNPELIKGEAHVQFRGEKKTLQAQGNGPISAYVHALRQLPGLPEFTLEDYAEETRGRTAEAEAVCYVSLQQTATGRRFIGAGFASNIDQAAVRAVTAAMNALLGG